jgi:hypothetical protein
MYFKGITPDGREIYSDTFSSRAFNTCILQCELTAGRYKVPLSTLEISFNDGADWFRYNEVKK